MAAGGHLEVLKWATNYVYTKGTDTQKHQAAMVVAWIEANSSQSSADHEFQGRNQTATASKRTQMANYGRWGTGACTSACDGDGGCDGTARITARMLVPCWLSE